MSKNQKNSGLDISMFDDPSKLEEQLKQYVSPSNRRRAKQNNRKAKKIASSYMDKVEQLISNSINESDFGPKVLYEEEAKEEVLDEENLEVAEEAPQEEDVAVDYGKSDFPTLIYGDEEETETLESEEEEEVNEPSEVIETNPDTTELKTIAFNNGRIWVNNSFTGSLTFPILSDDQLFSGFVDDETLGELGTCFLKHLVLCGAPFLITTIDDVQNMQRENPNLDWSRVYVFNMEFLGSTAEVYVLTQKVKDEWLEVFDLLVELINEDRLDPDELTDLILRMSLKLNGENFLSVITDSEYHNFKFQLTKEDLFKELDNGKEGNSTYTSLNSREEYLEQIIELTGYEREEGVDHDHEPFRNDANEDTSVSGSEADGDSLAVTEESGHNSESDENESEIERGRDGRSGDDSLRETDEEREKEEAQETEEPDDAFDEEDLEEELSAGFDEISEEDK